ncbi:MAG: TRAP transporter small permease subunit [Moraxellaceae bacterium]|nr:TRAP transporter small permease subunit [Moraxellaceae bacterium]
MKPFLLLANAIDRVTRVFGYVAAALVMLACLVSAGNALSRYLFSISSNAWLEVQWHMFAGIVMLGAAWTLRQNEHVRVDVFYGRLAPRTKAWVDLLGLLVFLMPAMILLLEMSWPYFVNSWISQETQNPAGGLKVWPARLMLPVGFALVTLQGIAEIIKRIAYLRGDIQMDTHYERPLQ